MNKPTDPALREGSVQEWMQLFEATILQPDVVQLAHRLKATKDAIVDRIAYSEEDASQTERRLLLAALRTISELERLCNPDYLRSYRTVLCWVIWHDVHGSGIAIFSLP